MTQSPAPQRLRLRWPGRLALAVGGVAITAIVAIVLSRHAATPLSPDRQSTLADARSLLARGRFAEAEAAARRVDEDAPGDEEALLVAAEAATRGGRYEAALGYYERLPRSDGPEAARGLGAAGSVAIHLGRLSRAEEFLTAALDADPRDVESHEQIAFVLGITGRRWEAVPHLTEKLRQARISAKDLIQLGDPDRYLKQEEYLRTCREAAPDDPLVRLALAAEEAGENRLDRAESLYREAIAARPSLVAAHAGLGRCLIDRPDLLPRWHAALPRQAGRHPEVWAVRGAWCRNLGQETEAARCFWEALRRDPNHRTAAYQLGQILRSIRTADEATPFLGRATKLQRLAELAHSLDVNPRHLESINEAAELTESLGRLWEAWAWSQVALSIDSRLDWARQRVARIAPRLNAELPLTDPGSNPARRIDLSSLPLPRFPEAAPEPDAAPPGSQRSPASIRFADRAEAAGVRFTFYNDADPSTEGMRLFEFVGGGVAVLDFDGDAWPDLYFTQGCTWPPAPGRRDHVDQLFRNLGGGRFEPVTEAAGVGDELFSHGVAAGDLDADGFADLYVANAGTNRLYRNNGDGTFRDVTAASGVGGERWTVSCLMADLSGDGLPELFDATYLTGENIYRMICTRENVSRVCNPGSFDGEPDVLYLNLGDGMLRDVSAEAGVQVPGGKGLGVVAADFGGRGQLSLFVANDAVANHYYVNQAEPGGVPRFSEEALARGLAFDRDGRAQACMGVAAGDADGDGLLDLFVTNYADESNTLYLQQPGDVYLDATRAAGLREPSWELLGFGTQFLDADLDGLPDLVLTNGHVDDFTHVGQEYHMRPQFFRNAGGGEFAELTAETLGPWFAGKYLGRGLARLDWDRDGREDFAVSHLDSPAALVTNQTEGAGRFLALQLRGTASARDPIGARVTVRRGNDERTAQLTAGDGYAASNQRQLVFGLAGATRADEVEVRWPSGRVQTFSDAPADSELLLIEGRERPLALPR